MAAKLWSMTDIATEVGAYRQTVWERVKRGLIPAPGYMTRNGIPYWSEPVARQIVASWVADLRVVQ